MAIITLSIPQETEDFINLEVAKGEFASKSELVKKAIRKFQEDLVVSRILQASRNAREDKILRGNLDDLLTKIK